ncbi:hypothetical protein ScPMuIL_009856 [Solemya velum]
MCVKRKRRLNHRLKREQAKLRAREKRKTERKVTFETLVEASSSMEQPEVHEKARSLQVNEYRWIKQEFCLIRVNHFSDSTLDLQKRKLPSFSPDHEESKRIPVEIVRVPMPTIPATRTESSNELVRTLYTGAHFPGVRSGGTIVSVSTEQSLAEKKVIKLPALKVLGEPPENAKKESLNKERRIQALLKKYGDQQVQSHETPTLTVETVYPTMPTIPKKEPDLHVTSTTKELNKVKEQNILLEQKVQDLTEVIGYQRDQLSKNSAVKKRWTVDMIRDSDEKTKMYTGLSSWSSFLALLCVMEHDVTEAKCDLPDYDYDSLCSLTLSDEMFAVLSNLKFGLFRGDMAENFTMTVKNFDQIFHIWISCLFKKLPDWSYISQPLNNSPNRFVPSVIRNTPKLKMVLCWLKLSFEVDTTVVEALDNKRQTIKILIGLNNQGSIVFSSGIWVLKAEGLMVATSSGILEMIEDGDTIIVPSDIDIGPSVSSRNVKTISLPYDKEEKIGTTDSVTELIYSFTQQALSRLKVFGIMDRIFPGDLLEDSYKIVAVCSQLSNIYHS